MVTTKTNRTLLDREPDFKKFVSLSPTSSNSPPRSGCLSVLGWTKIQTRIGLAISKCRRQKPKESPKNPKPKKSFWDSVRVFSAKNRDILALFTAIITLLAFAFMVYTHLTSAQSKPEIKPRPRFEIEQPPSSIPVQPANRIPSPSKLA